MLLMNTCQMMCRRNICKKETLHKINGIINHSTHINEMFFLEKSSLQRDESKSMTPLQECHVMVFSDDTVLT